MDKLKIKNLDSAAPEEFEVLFNPTELSIEENNSWEEQKKVRRKPGLQFTARSLRRIAMELFFDTFEIKKDVREFTHRFSKLLVASIDTSNGKRPPRCQITWGRQVPAAQATEINEFPMEVVLESLKQQYVLFLSDGTPVRAKLNVSFKEYIEPEQEEQAEPRSNSFPARTYIVKTGDRLSDIAGTLWRKPEEWRRIADANALLNPRQLVPGKLLIIPAIED